MRQTAETIFKSWDFTDSMLAVDGGKCYVPPQFTEVQFRNYGNCVDNWLFCLREIYGAFTDYILMSEDDVYWHPLAAYKVREAIYGLEDDFGFLSPWLSNRNNRIHADHNSWIRPLGSWCGALALILSRDAAKYILEHTDDFHEAAKGVHLDTAIGAVLEQGKFHNFAHKPALVSHLGDVSTFDENNRLQLLAQNSDARKPVK